MLLAQFARAEQLHALSHLSTFDAAQEVPAQVTLEKSNKYISQVINSVSFELVKECRVFYQQL